GTELAVALTAAGGAFHARKLLPPRGRRKAGPRGGWPPRATALMVRGGCTGAAGAMVRARPGEYLAQPEPSQRTRTDADRKAERQDIPRGAADAGRAAAAAAGARDGVREEAGRGDRGRAAAAAREPEAGRGYDDRRLARLPHH